MGSGGGGASDNDNSSNSSSNNNSNKNKNDSNRDANTSEEGGEWRLDTARRLGGVSYSSSDNKSIFIYIYEYIN
eukprot:scaffold234234_cov23-Cyclotella_meneghiniana.AAC.1